MTSPVNDDFLRSLRFYQYYLDTLSTDLFPAFERRSNNVG